MKPNLALTITSLLSLLLLTFHMTHDTIRQTEGSVEYPIPVIVLALVLYATLVLRERAAGYVIMFLGGLFAAGMIMIHAKGIVVRNTPASHH